MNVPHLTEAGPQRCVLKAHKPAAVNKGGRGVAYFGVRVSTDDDVNWTWCALAQDCVDIIQSHVVHHSVIDLHDLIPTSAVMKREFRKHKKKNTVFSVNPRTYI